MRDLCHKFVHDLYYGGEEILRGEVEIDETLFGRKCKFNCGDPRGQRIWILGIVHRSTHRLILYPLDARDEATLIPLIARHVEKGSSIYTDGWHAYQSLNDRGNDHYMVEHKYTFVQQYRNVQTGELKTMHINTIEGAWKFAREHFCRINGTSIENFEGHFSK